MVSAFYASSFLAILSLSITFWSAILLYVTPTKHVPLTLLNASTDARNIERILIETNFTQRGIYLPPKNLINIESSLIFIPKATPTPLPKPEETNERLQSPKKDGLFLTPPGFSLSLLFEQELGEAFINLDLPHLCHLLPKLLIEGLGIAENAEFQEQGNKVTMQITNSIFNTACRETRKLTRTHEQIGCLLPSAIACVLAKATGKPIVIANEGRSKGDKTTTIEYQIMEE